MITKIIFFIYLVSVAFDTAWYLATRKSPAFQKEIEKWNRNNYAMTLHQAVKIMICTPALNTYMLVVLIRCSIEDLFTKDENDDTNQPPDNR